VTATRQAYAALYGVVQQQAAMLSFIYAFRFLAILFVLVMPLILIMQAPRHKGGGGAGMH